MYDEALSITHDDELSVGVLVAEVKLSNSIQGFVISNFGAHFRGGCMSCSTVISSEAQVDSCASIPGLWSLWRRISARPDEA